MLDKLLHLPPNFSAHGPMIDHMMVALHWFMLVLFVGWSLFFLFCLWRFSQRRNPKANYHGVKSHFSTHAEAAVIIFEVFLLLGFAFPFWAQRVNEFPDPEKSTIVRVVGYQYGWHVHYPGKDGVFGASDESLVNAGNPLGIDRNDPNAKDDFTVLNTVTTPVGKPVILELSSLDVIHNFAIREMRIAQDAIPGSKIPMWFTPTKIAEANVICGQLCGSGHYSMRGGVSVVSAEDFESFITSNTPVVAAK